MSWLFKKSPRRKALDEEVKKAKWESYRKGRIERARTEGRRAGKLTRMERLGGAFSGLERSMQASNRAADALLGGSSGLFGLGEPPRRKHKSKGKGKKITIYVR